MKIWSLSTGQCHQTLQGHTDAVNSVIYLQDKDQVVSGSGSYFGSGADNTLKIWDVEGIGQKKPQPLPSLPPSPPPVVVIPSQPQPQPIKPPPAPQRTSGYFNLFHTELHFTEQDTETYTTLLKEEGYDTKDDFVEGLQDGDIDLNSFKDGKDKSIFKEGHQMKILDKFNLTTPSSSSPTTYLQASSSNQSHPNDIY